MRTRGNRSDSDPLWLRYELSVAELLDGMDETSEVLHNQKVEGRLSHYKRQVDVLVRGRVAAFEVTVAVECKKHGKPAGIGVIDAFVGKVLDVGADRGVIYSYAGFTSQAASRAHGSVSPNIVAIGLETPEVVARNRGLPGYPADLLWQEFAPQWVEEMHRDAFRAFLIDGSWNKFWS